MKNSGYRIILSIALVGVMLISIVSCGKAANTTSPTSNLPTSNSQASSSHTGMGEEITDVELATHIRSALLIDEITAPVQISVLVTKGDARLTGEVATQQQLDQVLKVTKSVAGVHTIHDELSVKK